MQLDSEVLKERYNRYVQLYNDNKRINEETLNTISDNEHVFQQRLEELENNIQDEINFFKVEMKSIAVGNLYAPKEESLVDSYQDQEAINLIDQIFEQLQSKVDSQSYIDQPVKTYRQLSDKIGELYSRKDLDNQISNPSTNIRTIISTGKIIRGIKSMLRANAVVKNKIIDGLFTPNLEMYGELSDSQKKELESTNNSKGRNLSKDVPQDKIENIVKKILSKFEKGQTIKANLKGETKGFSIIHQGGKRDGQVNINQIFKYFEAAHPDLIKLSSRQFKERIKMAIPGKWK